MPPRLALVLAVVLLLVASLPARAFDTQLAGKPLHLDLTESLYLNDHLDPGDGDPSHAYYGEGMSKLNVQASWQQWLLQLRLDSAAYASPPVVGERLAKPNCATPGGCIGTVGAYQLFQRYEDHLVDPVKVLEKMSLGYQGRVLEVTAGDFYASLGRGLVLSVRKVDELGVDTTLFGGKAVVRAGQFTGTALAGVTNIQNRDDATGLYLPDANDRIGAARLEYRFFDKVNVGVHGMYGLPSVSRLDTSQDHYFRPGLSIDAARPVDWLALYGEYAHAEDQLAGGTRRGNALYGAATVFAGKTTWLLEGKRYQDYNTWQASNASPSSPPPNIPLANTFLTSMIYMTPPTLERVTTQLTDNAHVTAGRLRTDVQVGSNVVAYASGEYGQFDPAGTLSPSAISLNHDLKDVYAGANVRWGGGGGHVFPLVGWREERCLVNCALQGLAPLAVSNKLVALEYDAAQPLTAEWSLESAGLLWLREEPGLGPWREGQVYLAVKRAPKLVVAAGYEFTTISNQSLNQHNFFNGSAQWNFNPGTSLRVFAGGQRPGLKCISGVCRTFPAFNGVRLELTVRG